MSEFYEIDSTRVSHREYWWGTKSPLVIIAWLIKWLRIRVPSSSDDPNTASTLPFVVEGLPAQVAELFQPLTAELASLGFEHAVYHIINDPGTRTTVFWATFRHPSGKHFARIHHRVWQQAQKPNRGLFPMFFTEFTDGTFLVSSAGKLDFSAPGAVQMNRMYRAKTHDLWSAHERLTNLASEQQMIQPVLTGEDLLAASERHHALVRDFNLRRGVFRPRSSAEQAKADTFAASVAAAQAGGHENAEVLAELGRLQEQKPGWRTAVWVLIGSLVVFLAAGAAKWNWKFTLWIIPVLFFHEAGHWVAMRLCRYRNLRMFFIPLFGAAVTGQHWNVPGWKKAVVSLAGPVPGIAVGLVLGVAGLVLNKAWINNVALILLLVNGLNLLPLLPLDGGHVLHATLFCRNRWLDVTFRIIAILGLIGLGVLGFGKLLAYIAIPMAIALPVMFKLGKVTDDLRHAPLPPPLPEEDRIPTPTAQAIISAVRDAFPKRITLSNKVLAQHTLNVFETLNAKPPGVLATLSLLALHGGAFLAAILVGLLLLVGKNGGLGDFAKAALRQPPHSVECDSVQHWQGNEHKDAISPQNVLITTFKNRPAARAAFSDLTAHAPPAATLTLFGDSVLLTLPAEDDTAREHWFDDLQSRSTNTFVAVSNSPVIVNLTFLAPTESTATNVARELKDFFDVAAGMHLIAPWSPEAGSADWAAMHRSRHAWTKISRQIAAVWRDPLLQAYPPKIAAAMKRGASAEANRLSAEQAQKLEELQKQARERLRAESPGSIDGVLVDLHEKLNSLNYTNREARALVLREIAGKLGEVLYQGQQPAPGADAYGVTMGFVARHGLLIEVPWLSLNDPTRGLPALTEWLCGLGCRQIKYDFAGSGYAGANDEFEQ